MADKKKRDPKLGDYVEVAMDGLETPVKIYKEDIPEEDWESYKKHPDVIDTEQIPTTIQGGRKAQLVRDGMTNKEAAEVASKLDASGDRGDYVVLGAGPNDEKDQAYVVARRAKETDDEWNARVAELQKHPRYESTGGIKDRQKSTARAEAQGEQAMRDRVVDKTVADPQNKELALSDYDRDVLERMNESDRRKFLSDRMKNKSTPVSSKPEGTASSEGDGTMGGKIRGMLGKLTSGATPMESSASDMVADTSTGEDTLQDRAMDASASSNELVSSFAPGGTRPTPAPTTLADPITAVQNARGFNAVDNGYTSTGAQTLDPAQPGINFDGPMGGSGRVAQGLKNAFTSNAELMAADEANQLDPLTARASNMPGVPPPVTPVPGSVMPQGTTGQGLKVSGSSTTNPSKAPAPRVDPYADVSATMEGGYKLASDALTKKGEIEAQRADLETELRRKQLADQGALQLERSAASNAYEQTMARGQEALTGLMTERRQLAGKSVDPNRYWASKDGGQKAAAVIAGALFGFTGQGMQWLQRLDGLVNDDVKLQQDELSRNRDNLDALIGDQRNIIALGEKRGLSRMAALDAAKAAKIEEMQAQIALVASQTSSPMAKANAQAGIAALEQSKAESLMRVKQAQEQHASQQGQLALGYARLQEEKRQFNIATMAKAAKGENKDKLPPAQQGIVQAATAGLAALPDLEKAIGNDDQKLGTAIIDQLMKNVPGSDAMNRDVSARVDNRVIFAGIDKSVINAADQKFLDELQAGVGWDSLKKKGAITTLRRLLTASRNSAIDTANQLNQDTGNMQRSPDISFTPSR